MIVYTCAFTFLAVFNVCFLNSHTVCVKGNTALFRSMMPLAKNGYASHMA